MDNGALGIKNDEGLSSLFLDKYQHDWLVRNEINFTAFRAYHLSKG